MKIQELVRTISAAGTALATVFAVCVAYDETRFVEAPQNLKAEYVEGEHGEDRFVKLSWGSPVGGKPKKYRILRRYNDETPGAFATVATVSGTDTSVKARCPAKKTCVFRVSGVNAVGMESERSNYQRCPAYITDPPVLDKCIYDPRGRGR